MFFLHKLCLSLLLKYREERWRKNLNSSYMPSFAVQLKLVWKRHLVCHAYIRDCDELGLEGY